MSKKPTRLTLLALLGAASLVVGACGAGETTAPTTGAPATDAPTATAPAETMAPFEPLAYPETGEAPCGVAPYTGNLKKISAPDAQTVVFELCEPDVAFLPKVAFAVFGIHDSDYLEEHMPDGTILAEPNGTGPYKLQEWLRTNRLVMTANENYWGDAPLTPNVEFRWSDQAAQRWLELQAGTVDGIDNPGTEDFDAIEANSSVTFYEREGLNTLYLGMNVLTDPWTDVRVRQAIAQGIDYDRIVDNFYPPGSEVATHFTPCAIPYACGGEDWWTFDAAAANALLDEANFDRSQNIPIQFRAAVRGYLPDPPQIATEVCNQLRENLGMTCETELQESGTFLDNNAAGLLDGIFLLGWGADYPDTSNFLDYHFGAGSGAKFGEPFPDVTEALQRGLSSADASVREQAYTDANNALREHVPMVIVAHGGSGTVFKADVEGAHTSPLGNEQMAVMQAGDRDTLVWMQNGEPISLYCGDETDGETLRACEQMVESLYAFEVGGTETIPALAESCDPNDDLTVWTCTLRQGVKFHNGADLDAGDVLLSYALQWDAEHPLHIGRTGAFEYFPSLWGGNLNPPPS